MTRKKSGALIYDADKRNHVIWPGREPELKKFVESTYKGMSHKQKTAKSSHSEDALTWSCFDVLGQVRGALREKALRELWEDSFGSDPKVPVPKAFKDADKVEIRVGKTYSNDAGDTEGEVVPTKKIDYRREPKEDRLPQQVEERLLVPSLQGLRDTAS